MKKITIILLLLICTLFSGCTQASVNDLVDVVNADLDEYLGEWDECQYISSEYDEEKDLYYLYYEKKVENNYIIRTYKDTLKFFLTDGEWEFHDSDTELVNAYLDIVETTWKTTPIRHWNEKKKEYVTVGDDITILDVSDDSGEISIMYGAKKIKLIREKVEREGLEFAYTPIDGDEVFLLRYNVTPSGKIKILLYLDYKPSERWIMPDLEYTLVD